MSATKPNGAAPEPPPPPPSQIVLTFAGPGLADCTFAMPGVGLGQLYAGAWLLDQLAREARGGAVAKEAMHELVSAPGLDLSALRRLGLV